MQNFALNKTMGRTWTLVAAFACLVTGVASATVRSAHADVQLRASVDKKAAVEHVVLHHEGAAVKQSARAQSSGLVGTSAVARFRTTMHAWLHPLSAAAVLTTVALQLSPMPSSLEIRRERDVKRYDGYPYFSVLAGATQWCLYGSYTAYKTKDMNVLTMVAANAPGMFFGIFYITNYFRFVPAGDARDSALKRYLAFGLCLLIMELTSCVVLGRGAVFWLGLLGSVGSAQIALSPFKTMPEVLRTRSTRSWPLDLCMWNLIQSLATGGFGVANDDPWVWVPNLIGVIAAVIQLSFIAAFLERPCGPRGTCVKLKATEALQ